MKNCRLTTVASPSTKSVADQAILQSWIRAYSDSKHNTTDFDDPRTRSASDSQAAWLKWHRGSAESWFSPAERPWYMALERARVECRAGRELPGVACNLRAIPAEKVALSPASRDVYVLARNLWGLGFNDREQDGNSNDGRFLKRLRTLIFGWQQPRLQSENVKTVLVQAGHYLDDELDFARVVHPLVNWLSVVYEVEGAQDPVCAQAESPEQGDDAEDEAEVGYGAEQLPERYSRFGDYAIFRTAWDQCELARVWHRSEDEQALRALKALDRRKVQKLAHQLQRRLLAQRLRHWDFELEDGVLDSRRLATLVGEHPNHPVFKCEREARVPEACVSLLVDQSGSMRGSSHLLAAQAIDFAVHTLEVCGVAVEVLGYTTCFGADNPVVKAWKKLGAPGRPGRLNALRHIVFKPAGQPWRVARRYLGLLLRSEFGCENIDGESLYWATRRLLARQERRKILIVLSDGSPYDEATISANDSQILSDHLSQVVRAVEQSPVYLVGIGMGREVGRFYSRATTVRRGDMIGEVLFRTLGDSLDQASPS